MSALHLSLAFVATRHRQSVVSRLAIYAGTNGVVKRETTKNEKVEKTVSELNRELAIISGAPLQHFPDILCCPGKD